MKFSKIINITLCFVFIITTLVGCRKINGGVSSGDLSYLSSDNYAIVDIVENDSSDIESVDSDTNSNGTQSNASGNGTTTSSNNSDTSSSSVSSDIFTQNVVIVGGNDNEVDPDAPQTFIEPDDNGNINTEITVYNGQTLATSPDPDTGDVVTPLIAAKGSVYYKIKGASNKNLTIKDADAYVIYDGTRYDAQNGVVSFTIASNELASAQILLEVGNKGNSDKSFTINFSSPKGTISNPEAIDSIDGGTFTVTIEEGNQQGYFYSYVASKNGKIRFYILSDAQIGKLAVSKIVDNSDPNNPITANGDTTCIEETKYLKTVSNSSGTYIEFDVKKGDEFKINASPNSNPGEYPSVNIKWEIKYN